MLAILPTANDVYPVLQELRFQPIVRRLDIAIQLSFGGAFPANSFVASSKSHALWQGASPANVFVVLR